jgi:hypothetical protein
VGILGRITRLRTRLEANDVSLFQDVNADVDVNVGGRPMGTKKLTEEELDRQRAEHLPDREVMSTVNPVGHPVPPVSADDDVLFPIDPTPKGPIGGTP